MVVVKCGKKNYDEQNFSIFYLIGLFSWVLMEEDEFSFVVI